jgi:hypothetical protein
MAQAGRKIENLTILKEIYQKDAQKSQGKKSVKEYFKDPKKVDQLLAVAILFFGLIGLIFGFSQFRHRIVKSFLPATGQNLASADEAPDLLGLKEKDTDSDGLSDYDELYVYNTSPYLKDSDSDGVEDKTEVVRQTDPNCPEGQNCFASWSSLAGNSAASQSGAAAPDNFISADQIQIDSLRSALAQGGMSAQDLANLSDAELLQAYQEVMAEMGGGTGSSGAASSASTAQQLQNLTPQQLRDLLTKAGMTNDILDNITDSELLNFAKETLSTTQSSVGQTATQPAPKTISLTPSNLQNLSPAQLRDLLSQAGVAKATLDKVSDDELLQLVGQTLNNYNKNSTSTKP